MRQLVAHNLVNTGSQMSVLIFQEELEPWSPFMIHRHFGIEPKDITPRANEGCGIRQSWEVLLKQGTNSLLVETTAQFNPWQK
jgi:hypothetical protein